MTTRADETGAECPSEEILRLFLAERVGASRAADVEAHVGVCKACQRVLERLVGGLSRTVDPAPGAATSEEDGPPDLPGHEATVRIGAGGMGVVWRARDLQFDRPLAVKVLKSSLRGRPEFVDRFLREARLCGQLTHPSIVPVHAMGVLADGRPYYTMKLVEGQTLEQMLSERRASGPPAAEPAGQTADPSTGKLLRIFEPIAHAVAFAHCAGIIHRDLKPQNVMVGAHGEVQVMDWGLAKVLREKLPARRGEGDTLASEMVEICNSDSDLTRLGSVLGTYAYMPPEQARGEVGEVDRRSDVFGLGAILCHLLTGAPPYTGNDVRRQAVEADLASARDRLRASGADAEMIVLAEQCLAPRKADRPADAGEVAAAVAAYHQGLQERREQELRGRLEEFVRETMNQEAEKISQTWTWPDQQQHREIRMEDPRAHLERIHASLEFTRQLDRLLTMKLAWAEDKLDPARADREYEALFRGRGLGQPDEAPAVVAGRIRDSRDRFSGLLPQEIMDALIDWADSASSPRRKAWLLEVIRLVDPRLDRIISRLCDPAAREDPTQLQTLVNETAIWQLSPEETLLLSQHLPAESALALLKQVQLLHPDRFHLNFTLGTRLVQAKAADDAVGYFRVALTSAGVRASRAGTLNLYYYLGVALIEAGKKDEAIECFRTAIGLTPGLAHAYARLGDGLLGKGEHAEASEAFMEALKLLPNNHPLRADLFGQLDACQHQLKRDTNVTPGSGTTGLACPQSP